MNIQSTEQRRHLRCLRIIWLNSHIEEIKIALNADNGSTTADVRKRVAYKNLAEQMQQEDLYSKFTFWFDIAGTIRKFAKGLENKQ